MNRDIPIPSPESLLLLLEKVHPGSAFVALHPLDGDFSNSTHLVEGKGADGSPIRVVTRRYAVFGDYDRGEKARREFQTLQLVARRGIPAPEPLVLDWEEAASGDPGIDVASCLMDIVLRGLKNSADVFLAAYEAETGGPVANLAFWELAAAVRPMFNPAGWITDSPARERFAAFVDDAIRRISIHEPRRR